MYFGNKFVFYCTYFLHFVCFAYFKSHNTYYLILMYVFLLQRRVTQPPRRRRSMNKYCIFSLKLLTLSTKYRIIQLIRSSSKPIWRQTQSFGWSEFGGFSWIWRRATNSFRANCVCRSIFFRRYLRLTNLS